jgi:hypothetical protein
MRKAALLVLLGAGALGCTRTTELLGGPAVPACVGTGPPIRLGGPAAADCTGALAARFGRYALCTCTELAPMGGLFVQPLGPPGKQPGPVNGPGPAAAAPRAFVAAVGTDGNFRVGHLAQSGGVVIEVAGSLIAAGADGATFVHGGHIQGNLRGAGPLTTMTTMGVWVSGEMVAGGDVSGMFKVVGGPLHAPAGATIAPDVAPMMGVVRETVAVSPPCACGATSSLDLPAEVAARKANATPFAAVLSEVDGPQTLDLRCGEFYLPEIRTADGAPLELLVHGHVGLFVGGDVHLGSNFTVTLDDGAELDLVVAGNFDTRGRVFGSPTTPSRTRLWVGSTIVSLPDEIQFGAAVYAPNAVFSAGSGLSFSGSLFVGTLHVAGDVRLAYDPRVTEGGQLCGAPAPTRVE